MALKFLLRRQSEELEIRPCFVFERNDRVIAEEGPFESTFHAKPCAMCVMRSRGMIKEAENLEWESAYGRGWRRMSYK